MKISNRQISKTLQIPKEVSAVEFNAGAKELILDNVFKSFGGVNAVADVSLTVHEGEILGIIGPNGAGKTTLVNLVSGVLTLTSGSIQLDKVNIDRWQAHSIAEAGVRRTFQTCRLIPSLTTLQNVLVAFPLPRIFDFLGGNFRSRREGGALIRERAKEILALCGLQSKEEMPAGSLAYGEQRRLELARAVAPPGCNFLLLDEPAAGMSDSECQDLIEVIKNLRDSHSVGVMIIEHHVDLIFSLCDRVGVMDFGKLITLGIPEDVRTNSKVLEAYLGRRHA